MLFERNFLFAHRQVDSEITEVTSKYFQENAMQWLTPMNVALIAFAKVPLFTVEAVKTGSFPDSVGGRDLLKAQKERHRSFFQHLVRLDLA